MQIKQTKQIYSLFTARSQIDLVINHNNKKNTIFYNKECKWEGSLRNSQERINS